MTIHIITVYNSLNYGSYYQANALKWELEHYGTVDFLDIHHQNNFQRVMKESVKYFLTGKFSLAWFDLKRLFQFSRSQRAMPVVSMEKVKNSWDEDIFIFGSDEIWNIKRPSMRRSKAFFGCGVPVSKRIAVAPSINRANLEDFQESSYVSEELKRFAAISVRDRHSKEVIENVAGVKCLQVADPTLMFDKTYYGSIMQEPPEKNYIVIYSYGEGLTEERINAIVHFAKERNLSILSIGNWFPFCDKCMSVKPEQFLGYFNQADYILTDTFHGLMFSLIFEKQFASLSCNNTKVEDTLRMFELDQRLIKEQSLETVLDNAVDYSVISPLVREYGQKTRTFIRDSIMGLKNCEE